MKEYFIQITTPLRTFNSGLAQFSEQELQELQKLITKVVDGEVKSFSITDENGNVHYFSSNLLSRSVISIIEYK